MKYELKSTLEAISTDVFKAKTKDEARDVAISHLEKTQVKDKDKMIKELKTLPTLYKIQQYICNALLKFEGLGMAQLSKPKDI